MKKEKTDLIGWQKRYGTEEACAAALQQQRWPEGFVCPRCGHDQGYFPELPHRLLYACPSHAQVRLA